MAKNNKENPVTITKEDQYIYSIDPSTGEEYSTLNPAFQKEQKKKLYEYYLKYSGIPKEYWDIDTRSIKISDTLRDQAIEYVNTIETKKTNLYLWGAENSTGKTSLACAIGQDLLRKGYECYFGMASDVIKALMKTSGFNSDKYNEEAFTLIKRLSTADVIIIDDIFDPNKSIHWTTKSNNLIVGEWDSLLRSAVNDNKKIILTSNKSLQHVAQNFSTDLANLLDRSFTFIEFTESIHHIRKEQL